MMRKLVGFTLILAMVSTMVVGCGQENVTQNSETNKSEQQEEVTEKADTNTNTQNEKLVIYSSTNQGAADKMVAMGKEIGIDITMVLGGGGDIIERIIAEKDNPTADLIYGSNSIGLAQLKAEDCLEKYTPEWKGELDQNFYDPDGYYYGVSMSAILLAFNAPYLGAEAPKDWPDLWENANLKGKYFVNPSTKGGTTRLVLSGILARYRDDKGELGVAKEGWEAIQKYYENAYISQESDNFFEMLTSEKTGAGQNFSTGIVDAMTTYDTEISWATPEVGVPFAIEMVALIKDSKNNDAATKFLDYFGKAEIQETFCETVPCLENGRGNVSEDLNKIIDSVKSQDIDFDWVVANLDSWIEKIELEYIP